MISGEVIFPLQMTFKRGVGIEGIQYATTKSKETRSKILALASTKDSASILLLVSLLFAAV